MLAILCIALALALLFNIFIIVVIARRKRLRTPATFPSSIIYMFLAGSDLLAALIWTLPTVLTLTMNLTETSSGLCKAQVVVMALCNLLSAHVLAALMFERFLKLFIPSKHVEIFFDLVVALFLASLTVFNIVLATFPLWTWGKIIFFETHHQCGIDFSESESHFRLTMIMNFALPALLVIGFYVAILVRICRLKKRRGPNGDIIVEENLNVVGDSYSDRLKEVYAKFKDAGSRSTKPVVKEDHKGYNTSGYHSDTDDFESSGDDEDGAKKFNYDDYDDLKRKGKAKKTHYLAKSDVIATHMYALMSLVYFGVWVPYVAWIVLYTYYYRDVPLSDGFMMAAVILSHCGTFCKAPFYFMSTKFRTAFVKTVSCTRKGGVTRHTRLAETKSTQSINAAVEK